jgi:hypothetical protein
MSDPSAVDRLREQLEAKATDEIVDFFFIEGAAKFAVAAKDSNGKRAASTTSRSCAGRGFSG